MGEKATSISKWTWPQSLIICQIFWANRSSEVYFSAAACRDKSSTEIKCTWGKEKKKPSSIRRAAAGQRVSCLLLKEISESGLWSSVTIGRQQGLNPLPGSGHCFLAQRAPLAAHHRSFSGTSERKAHTPGQRWTPDPQPVPETSPSATLIPLILFTKKVDEQKKNSRARNVKLLVFLTLGW